MRSEKVLVSMKKYIGDSIMAAPLLDALEPEFGQPITLLCSRTVSQVLENPGRVRHFVELDAGRKPREVLRAASELRKMRFDIAIMVNHSFRSALTALLAGIPRRIGHKDEGRAILLTDAVPYDEDRYESLTTNDLAKPLGIEVPGDTPRLGVRDSERESGLALLDGATVGLQPGARYASKSLSTETMSYVAKRLQGQGVRLALLGGAEEREAAERLAATLPEPVVDLVGRTSIRETLGVLSNLRLMLGADTGLMHMAVAVDAPTITVFGPTRWEKWGHPDEKHQILSAPERDMSRLDPQLFFDSAAARLG